MAESGPVHIDVWSDYVCPFCYLEEPVLQRLREEAGDELQVTWRAFELRPDPVPTLDPRGEYLRTTWARAVYPMAAQRGMTLRLPPVQPRSRLALEAAEHAREQGCYEAMHHALFRAFFEEGLDIGSEEVLVGIGEGIGLDGEALREVLRSGRYTERVLRDQEMARDLGISAVPAMLIRRAGQALDEAEALSGAQPYEWVRRAVERARTMG